MIVSLTGTVARAGATDFTMVVSGVGFGALTTPATAAALRVGETTTVHTSMVVREDSHTLFGFLEPGERDAFELVQQASGVGPKLALAMVSVLSAAEIKRAVLEEDLLRLCSVPGIGKKGAQKLVIELKDKVAGLDADESSPATAAPEAPQELWREQVSEGLQSLGWSTKDAAAACDNVAHLAEEATIAELMRAALGSLARH